MRDSFVKTSVFEGRDFPAGSVIAGPAVVEQLDSTTVIFPGQTALVDDFGNIIIDLKGGGQ
jgi:N-methylhydantoinase A